MQFWFFENYIVNYQTIGADRFRQQVRLAGKHAVCCEYDTIILILNKLQMANHLSLWPLNLNRLTRHAARKALSCGVTVSGIANAGIVLQCFGAT